MTTLKRLPDAQHAIIMAIAAGAELHYNPGYVFLSTIIKPSYKLHTPSSVETARMPSVTKLDDSGYLAKLADGKHLLSELGERYAAQFSA